LDLGVDLLSDLGSLSSELGLLQFALGADLLLRKWLVADLHALPPTDWQELKDEAPNQGGGSQSDTVEVLHHVERHSLGGSASVLDDGNLERNGEDHHEDEDHVVEEILEHVDVGLLDLPGVDDVENLQEHEDVEHVGKMS